MNEEWIWKVFNPEVGLLSSIFQWQKSTVSSVTTTLTEATVQVTDIIKHTTNTTATTVNTSVIILKRCSDEDLKNLYFHSRNQNMTI
jgi:hypothetical protein